MTATPPAGFPSLSSFTSRHQGARWVAALGGWFLLIAAAATTTRWKVAEYWQDPRWHQDGVPFEAKYERTVFPHALAMTIVIALMFSIVVPLMRAAWLHAAVLVAVGAALGPLRLVAGPMIGDLESYESNPTFAQQAWPILVGAVLALALTLTAGWLVGPVTHGRHGSVAVVSLAFAGPLFLMMLIPGAAVVPGSEQTLSRWMLAGWALIVGGLIAAGLVGESVRGAGWVRAGLVAATLAIMRWAYYSEGWQMVPGWDYQPNSPHFLNVPVAVMLALSGLLGAGIHRARRAETTTPGDPQGLSDS